MRWKSVALVGAIGPAALGCHMARNAARNVVNEPLVVCTQRSLEHDLRKQAKGVWGEVRAEYPRRAFTAEFRDGFLDGYVDYLDRGGRATLPAVPPPRYTRHKKYFTENGQCLVKDYFLGFKYGQDIAVATGKREFLTVPVLLPQKPEGPPAFTLASPATAAPGTQPWPAPAVGPTPGGEPPLPTPRPLSQPDADSPPKFGPPPSAGANTLPPPSPPLPVRGNPPPVAEVPPAAAPAFKLPAPPAEVPELPASVPTPSALDELPVVPPAIEDLPVVPPSLPEADGK